MKFMKGFGLQDPRQKANKILVVGGAGYLGSVLVPKLLKRGYLVRVLDNFTFGKQSLEPVLHHHDLEVLKGTITNIEDVKRSISGVQHVVHLAGLTDERSCEINVKLSKEVNYTATLGLASLAKERGIQKFVFASTCAVYGTSGASPVSESSPLNPQSLYAQLKASSETDLLQLMSQFFVPCVLRFGTMFGFSPRMRFDIVLNTFSAMATKLGRIQVHGGQQWRPTIHVSDAADACIAYLEAPVEKVGGQVFNAGSNEQNYQILDLAELVKICTPRTRIEKVQSQNGSSYRVSFDKIGIIPGFRTTKLPEYGIREIQKVLNKGIIQNFEDERYYNSKVLGGDS